MVKLPRALGKIIVLVSGASGRGALQRDEDAPTDDQGSLGHERCPMAMLVVQLREGQNRSREKFG